MSSSAAAHLLLLLTVAATAALVRGESVYDEWSQMCCDGQVFPRSNANSGCCSGHLYNTSVYLCCPSDNDELLVPIPHPDVRDKQVGRSVVSYECCGGEAIDPATHFCCKGQPHLKLFSNSACCGSKEYDADRFMCCGNGALFRRNSSKGRISQCCGNQGYDPKKFVCCEDKVHRIWSSTTTACCGKNAFDIGFQGCCGGQEYDDPFGIFGCCGNHTYEMFIEICCDGTVHPDPLRSKTCCGNMAYDPTNQTCCSVADGEKRLTSVKLKDNEKCCGNLSYDSKTHMCCNATVVRRLSERSECCGAVTFEKGGGDEECCGGNTVTSTANGRPNKTQLRCCNGHAVEVPKDKKLCC